MKKIKELIFKYKELIIYVLFGLATTVVNFSVLWVFNRILGDELYLVSNVIAWFAAVVFSYITSKLWVFESKSWEAKVVIKEVVSFFAARILSLGVEELGLYLLIDVAGLGDYGISLAGMGIDFEIGGLLISKAILAVAVVVINYVFSKLVIFKKKTDTSK